jgi:hypothetical protein
MKPAKILLASLLMLLTVSLFSSPAHAVGFQGTATIDGIIEWSEWFGAPSTPFNLGGGYTGTFLVMNDATNLYLAVTIADSTLETGVGQVDRVEFSFDNDNDGSGPVTEAGDDQLYSYGDHLADRFWDVSFADDISAGGTNDGSSLATHETGFNTFELSHPLDDADNAHDFSLHFGDTVGFQMNYYHGGTGAGYASGYLTGSIDIVLPHPDLVMSPHGLDVGVGSTFTIDIWIKNIPGGFPMTSFEFYVGWDSTMIELIDHDNLADTPGRNWVPNQDSPSGSPYSFYTCASEASDSLYNWASDEKWATLEFRCIAEGSSIIDASGEDTVYLQGPLNVIALEFDADAITCNQRQQAPSNPYHYVGGELFAANKLAVLSPYLALFSVVAVAVVLVKWRKI